MNGDISITDALEAQLPAMLTIYNEVIEHTTAVYDYQPHSLAMRTAWFLERKKAGYPVIVASIEEQVVGFGSYGPFRAWPAYQFSVEHSLYVDQACRGKGIGRLVLETLLKRAREQQLHSMIAGIDATNTGSIRLHEKLGFKQMGSLKEVG